jgi:uncharacterized damage-inducible protein DinB
MMSPRTANDFQQLFQYNRWANERILETMRAAEETPARALELFSHLLRAQDHWYGRVEATDHAALDFWTTESLAACAERLEASTQRWQAVLDERATDRLDQMISYTNSNGTPYETSLRDILTHVVNHGTHHRAQIALVLRDADITPPATDYIYFVREE